MEVFLAQRKQQAHNKTKGQREQNLKKRLQDDRQDINGACGEGFRYAKGNGEHNKTHRIVQRNDRQEYIGYRSLCLVLSDDHQRGGGGGCGCNGCKSDGRRQRQFVGDDKMQCNQLREFGVILDACIENDLKKLKLADEFAKKNNITYKVKLHPGFGKEYYGEVLKSDRITNVYLNEINVEQFSEMIDFALIGCSVVFMEYTLKLLPVFLYKELEEDDIYEGIDWCKVTDMESMQILYDRLTNDKDAFEKDLKDTRAFLCECENVAQNYREFFEKYSK